MTHITFILPGRGTKPVGGFKIIYEYANRLSARGMRITLVHTAWLYKSHKLASGIGRYIYCVLFYWLYKKWFTLSPAVNSKWVLTPSAPFIPDADFVFASSWETAEHVASLPSEKGIKMYLVQADESEYKLAKDNGWKERVLKTWNLPLQKIAVSSWLQQRIEETGSSAYRVFNGLDFKSFTVKVSIESRIEPVVMMLYHASTVKGWIEGLAALRLVHEEIPGLRVILFGVPGRPRILESWITYYQLPPIEQLVELYNRSSIFLSPSHSEGWGLTVSEAMQCGCAVVSSDIGGFKDFVHDRVTGLVFAVKNVSQIVSRVLELIANPPLRITLARNGNSLIQQFTWERAVRDMSGVLTQLKP